MQALQVKNWDKFQARKDRSVRPQHIWIKLYRALLTDFKWISLSDSEQGHLVNIWLLAAEKNGIIQDTAEEIKIICHLTDSPNLIKFIELGFLLVVERKDNEWLPVDVIDNQWLPVDSNGCLEERDEIEERDERDERESLREREFDGHDLSKGLCKNLYAVGIPSQTLPHTNIKKPKKRKQPDSPNFKTVPNLNMDAWELYEAYRKEVLGKGAYKVDTRARMLAQYPSEIQMEAVIQTCETAGDWTGLFPERFYDLERGVKK